jgi:voltage-gated potassium channel Kch
VVLLANTVAEAMELYQAGAGYVIVPHELGAEYASLLLHVSRQKIGSLRSERRKHMLRLRKRLSQQDHGLNLHHRWTLLH